MHFVVRSLLLTVILRKEALYRDRSCYGPPEYKCRYCNAIFWFEERIKSDSCTRLNRIVYNNCCKGGKISIPAFPERPEPLLSIARFDGDA